MHSMKSWIIIAISWGDSERREAVVSARSRDNSHEVRMNTAAGGAAIAEMLQVTHAEDAVRYESIRKAV